MSRKDFDTNKYLELAKTLKLDSMDENIKIRFNGWY